MAQKVQVVLVDDLDGGTAQETVSFGLDGVSYEIDLNAEHVQELRDALAPWIGHARKVGRASRPARRARATGSSSNANEIRQWARENGFQVNERGRISAEIKEAYEAAH
ncbi:MAG: histone-like nucleoid-structuring protein Lsr2 [Cellulomonadaceae bacterium]